MKYIGITYTIWLKYSCCTYVYLIKWNVSERTLQYWVTNWISKLTFCITSDFLPGSGCVVSHEFVHQWQHNYMDTHQASVHVFEHFDMNRNGAICHDDIAALFTATDHTSKLIFFNKMVAIWFVKWYHRISVAKKGTLD